MGFRDIVPTRTRHYNITKLKSPRHQYLLFNMSALFNFSSLLQVILLLICTCTYVHSAYPSLLDNRKSGALGVFWKFARIGERLSPYVAIGCLIMAFNILKS